MRKILSLSIIFLFTALYTSFSSPKITFSELLTKAELNPQVQRDARTIAVNKRQPVNVLTTDWVMMDAKFIEDGKVVYAVFKNLYDVYNGGYTAFWEEIVRDFDLQTARLDFGNGNITDNTGGMFDPVITLSPLSAKLLMVPDWTADKVYLFSAANGDLVDANFIPSTNPQLQSPKHALRHPNGKHIVVSDQLSDLVQRFDTSGPYLGYLAPSGGVNNSILDNIRGIAFRPNWNLLVTVASSANQNTIQQFDTGGVLIGTFIGSNLTSPFDILIRTTDILVSCSSGNDVVRFDLNGGFLSVFNAGTDISFAQQMHRTTGGRIAVSSFSIPNSGLTILDSNGVFVSRLTSVTGNRGVYLLGNGHYLVTNSAGIHEIDSATGVPVRTVVTGSDFQYISYYDPDYVVSSGNSNNNLPAEYKLYPNYPNPFNPVTNIKFQVPAGSFVKITVFDVTGKETAVLVNELKKAGTYEVSFNGDGLASGIYYYQMESDGYKETMKMILIK